MCAKFCIHSSYLWLMRFDFCIYDNKITVISFDFYSKLGKYSFGMIS
ncbi:hypothetical protein EJK55_1672 [Moraxella catarrhalis]|uniref:Uncharacterized protein n=1 Tax=Moraxella catarrhalis TaxID=480 RepID=A0A3S9QE53_MORCA|nr:hypothetical protein MCR_1803 [Moraxella catarrhalis BBH18]AZQ86958.1 hypothetical protein EJK52_1854 [Moraxella catarrhalis]EKF82880.1 hypothetical protein MCRH_1879 [Moraxella catarrhalis RH4]AZQ90273.1 hypothetical protein EJK50_1949 [Moraxella catarrhalis]AZQ90676.1 hypothetical protein EJK51_1855 [Moraxella catarrhalis]